VIQKRFRQDYDGEFVISEIRVADGQSSQQREWIANPIQNFHISGRAAAIGSRIDEKRFRHQRLQRHRGGLLGKDKLQTYATGDIWTDMKLDFFVSVDVKEIRSLVKTGYDQHCTVLTSPRHCLDNPGRFYIVPYLPTLHPLALVIYLAAFDGHKEVFMIGYSKDLDGGSKSWINDVHSVMSAYDTTQFILVGNGTQPDSWLQLPNVSQIDHRKFVTYCDI